MTALSQAPPAAPPPGPWRLTHEEYHSLGEHGFFRGKRVELIRGEVIEMSAMGRAHAIGVQRAARAVQVAFGSDFHVQSQLPLKFLGSEPEPDAAVLSGEPSDYPTHPWTALLILEVAESTLDYDLSTKAELYAEAGIADYWVVDLASRELHVLRDPRPIPAGGHRYYHVSRLAAADSIAPLAAPGSPVKVADLLP